MRKIIVLLISSILLLSLNVFAQDMYIDTNGNVGIGTTNPTAGLEVEPGPNIDGVVGYSTGTGISIYGENKTSGNYGYIGGPGYGVYGYSVGGYAGFFQGNARVTGTLTIDGLLTGPGIADITGINAGAGLIGGGTSGNVDLDVNFNGTGVAPTVSRSDHNHDTVYSVLLHNHSGDDINSGIISEVFLDSFIARDAEIMPKVLSLDGSGSGLNADELDGHDSSSFATANNVTSLEARVTGLESLIGSSSSPQVSSIINSASRVSNPTPYSVSELELWIRAAQKGAPSHPQSDITEVDMNGDGVILANETNLVLAVAGLVTQFVTATGPTGLNQVSPWNENLRLWVTGGVAPVQNGCDAIASANNPGQITICYYPSEDQHIESLFISATDNLGNLVYRKSLHGITPQERKDDMLDIVEKSIPELELWIRAVQKGSPYHPQAHLREIDINGDGTIEANEENAALAVAGVVVSYAAAGVNMQQRSPWNAALPLWTNGGLVANQAGCDAIAIIDSGQAQLCYSSSSGSDDETVKTLFVSATDSDSNLLYSKSLHGITPQERKDDMLDIVEKSIPELEVWIRAAQKGSPMHPQSGLAEVDINGNGVIENHETNTFLATSGVVTSYVVATVNKQQFSPWNAEFPLFNNGGPVANQAFCDAIAIANPGKAHLCFNGSEDETVKTLFVSATDNDSNLLYSTSVKGETRQERRDVMLDIVEKSIPELEVWIRAVQKGSPYHPQSGLAEVDMDGDGAIENHETNAALATAGFVVSYVAATINKQQLSPWNAALPLYRKGGPVANQASCDAMSIVSSGQITICFDPSEDQHIESLFISATDNLGNLLYSKSVHGITPRERMDSVLKTIDETVPVLVKWIAAGKKAWSAEGTLTEIDTNGDGVVMIGTDMTNHALATSGIITQFISSRDSSMEARSPYNYSHPLWVNAGHVPSQSACNAVAQIQPGQITLCYYPAEDETIQAVFISAHDWNASRFYWSILTDN